MTQKTGASRLARNPVWQTRLNPNRRGGLLLPFGLLFVWPFLIPPCLVSLALGKLGLARGDTRALPPGWLILPYTLITQALRLRLTGLAVGVALCLPLLILALTSPLIDPAAQGPLLTGPSADHLLGTDGLGRDILARLISGSLNTYLVAVCASLVALGLGVALGLASFGLPAGGLIPQVVEFMQALPMLVWILMLLTVFSLSRAELDPASAAAAAMDTLRPLFIGILVGLGFLPNIYHLIRDKVGYFKRQEFVTMTRAHGVGLRRILVTHILLRNTLSDLMIAGGSLPGLAILALLSVDYFFSISSFQVGAARYAGWTQMLLTPEAKNALLFGEHLWLVIPAGVLIMTTAIGCYLYGAGLRNLRRLEDRGLVENMERGQAVRRPLK